MDKVCLVGDVIVDVTLKNNNDDLKMRLGGIIHSARAFWAISYDFGIGYISPTYLDTRIFDFSSHLNNPKLIKVADTLNAPNLILIEEAREIGDQGYELILREEIEYKYHDFDFDKFEKILITSGQFDIRKILDKTEDKQVSIELANLDYQQILDLNYKFNNIYISTSSHIFKTFIESQTFTFEAFSGLFKDICNTLIFKENRGGTRAYNFIENRIYQVSSQTKPIQHSVGVGDVFNAIFEASIHNDIQKDLALSSFVAMEYASTTFPVNFKNSVEQLLKIDINDLVNLQGVILNWEMRNAINIYIAAPDFDFVDTRLIDKLADSLIYHNFSPRRPVKENGQMKEEYTIEQKKEFYIKDHEILNDCKIVIAVLLYNDPGTLVEIGIASERKIPVLLYDPYNIAKNCMLTNSCKIVTNNMDEIISEVFTISSEL
ncbi:nucleoside 2-deoxyribosyltransferase [Elizabethkingia miricola]|uniref:Nucleoside 2-deoxyribosyltransferase n=1 Tax=Elizabethkingia miricola TaxID=172045 RepID=A0ABD5B1R2_ELIMR|nr:nucleoside 2-deoxyribosyltransferase [Elizabethkingia miricola]MDQ8747731.1 nucleoside 2-deoxyribosyltransferase [Elizabethkingia miricola]